MVYALFGRLRAYVGRLTAWEYRDSHKGIKRRDGPVNGLYGGFAFLGAASHRWTRAQKCRLQASGGPTSGGKLLGSIGTRAGALDSLEGMKKPAPGCHRAGAGGIQDFFAVSQIIIKGRARINRIIKRGSPPPTSCPCGAQNNSLRRSPLWCRLSCVGHAPKMP